MNRRDIYHSDPEILGGTSVFTGTRVPIETLLVYLHKGKPIEDFRDDFPTVDLAQINGLLSLKDRGLVTPWSVERVIRKGKLVVNGPVKVLMFVGLAVAVVLGVRFEISGWGGFASIFLPIGLAWLWWSIALPRWRIWALERVDDWGELIHQAVACGLMWPPGHFFEKTEIRSRRLRDLEKEMGWGAPYQRTGESEA